jgi:hypothetical protein
MLFLAIRRLYPFVMSILSNNMNATYNRHVNLFFTIGLYAIYYAVFTINGNDIVLVRRRNENLLAFDNSA